MASSTSTLGMVKPVQLAKKLEIRPQMIFNWIKQGAPSYRVGGKTYVKEDQIEQWRKDREGVQRSRKALRKSKSGNLTDEEKEILALVTGFKPQTIEAPCDNCATEFEHEWVDGEEILTPIPMMTQFRVDMTYTAEEWTNSVTAHCTKCTLNHRFMDGIPNAILVLVLRGEHLLWLPDGTRSYNEAFGTKTPWE